VNLQVPFEARALKDLDVHPIEVGVEYTVVDVSEDGSRFAAELADGTLGWFPAKYVRVLDSRQPQRAQQTMSYNTHVQHSQPSHNTNVYSTNVHETRNQHDDAKRQAAEKERRRLELKKKLSEQQTVPGRVVEADVNDEEIDQATRQLEKMKTYTETRGYLSNAPGFSTDLSRYIEDDEAEHKPQPKPEPTKTNTKASQQTNTGTYRKVEERSDGPKYVPSTDLPPQYTNSPWKCHSCQTTNGADRPKCNMCGTLRGELSVSVSDSNSSAPGMEWTCSSCKVSNAPSRGNCIMCGNKYKPSEAATKTNQKTNQKGDKKAGPAGSVKKKAIVTKAGSGVELQYARGIDNYKTGGIIPGHGAGY